MEPITPNCIKYSGLHSTFAPESISMNIPSSFGITGASAARLIPRIRFTIIVAPTTSAPVLPAEMNASPCPSASCRSPSAIEQSFLARIISVGGSSIDITVGASTIAIRSSEIDSAAATRRISSARPVNTSASAGSSSSAIRQPFRISAGA